MLNHFFPYMRRFGWCNGEVYNFFRSFFGNADGNINGFLFYRLTTNGNMRSIQIDAYIPFFQFSFMKGLYIFRNQLCKIGYGLPRVMVRSEERRVGKESSRVVRWEQCE